jgi:hypothetical protein
MIRPVWKVGDFVRFAHQANSGPSYRVSAVIREAGEPSMLELTGWSGRFAMHIFVAAPSNHDDVQDAAAGEK